MLISIRNKLIAILYLNNIPNMHNEIIKFFSFESPSLSLFLDSITEASVLQLLFYIVL